MNTHITIVEFILVSAVSLVVYAAVKAVYEIHLEKVRDEAYSEGWSKGWDMSESYNTDCKCGYTELKSK
jgi:hypothetical protein